MPRKKKAEEAVVEETVVAEAAAPKKTAKKTTAKKTAKKAEATTAETAEKKTTKKTAAKATEKKTAEKKTTAKKTATAKKAAAPKKTAKKAAEKEAAPEVAKMSVKDYEDKINWKKGEANGMDWLYIEINAGDLLTEFEAGVDNLEAVCKAVLNTMLEGDGFIVEPAAEDKVDASLTVRYYCDNLSDSRKKFF